MNFPINPTLNQTYTYGGKTWKWDGTAWNLQAAGVAQATVAFTGSFSDLINKPTTLSGYGITDGYTIPTQTGNTGKYLTTNGTITSWATVPASLTGITNSATPFLTALGTGAGANTTGVQNVAVGYGSLNSNTTGAYSTAIGYQALAVSTGGQNTAIGRMAMFTANTASGNTAVGVNAMYSSTTGGNNVAVGDTAGFGMTTGSNNTAIGNGAFYNGGTLSGMTAIGYQAMLNSSTIGNYNTAVGWRALFSQDSYGGDSNTAIGYSALLNLKGAAGGIAQSNTAVGSFAGQNLTGVGNNNNTVIGAYAGNLITSGSANTIIGANAGSNITTGSKNTIIGTYNGNQGGLNITTSSNYIVLSDGDGNPRGMFNSNGYFEASPSGGFPDGTNLTYHYFSSPVSAGASGDQVLMCRADSASFAGSVFFTRGNRNTVNSTFNSLICRNGNDTGVFAVRDSGNCANTNNSYGAYSDIALKENIADATPKLDALMQVKIRHYNLKAKPEEKHIGVIAQELETVFPGLVETDNEGIKNVKYSIFVPMLIKAIQELKLEVETLKSQLQ